MFLLAFVGGSALGRFVAAGIDLTGAPVSEGAMMQAATPPLHSSASAPLTGRALPAGASAPAMDESPRVHVCEGCDAAETRYRQMAQAMGFAYELAVANDTPPVEEMEAPPLPQLPALRRVQADAAPAPVLP